MNPIDMSINDNIQIAPWCTMSISFLCPNSLRRRSPPGTSHRGLCQQLRDSEVAEDGALTGHQDVLGFHLPGDARWNMGHVPMLSDAIRCHRWNMGHFFQFSDFIQFFETGEIAGSCQIGIDVWQARIGKGKMMSINDWMRVCCGCL